ncbi:MAG: DUF3073 domain-containing protein [Actinomycetota bacterium]|nr:DUF3073 domain-containing protein [Actinomycetota bacterium]
MGRGRAKAKQTKVARELKYYSPDTDLNALQRELRSHGTPPPAPPAAVEPEDSDEEGYGDYSRWASEQR